MEKMKNKLLQLFKTLFTAFFIEQPTNDCNKLEIDLDSMSDEKSDQLKSRWSYQNFQTVLSSKLTSNSECLTGVM